MLCLLLRGAVCLCLQTTDKSLVWNTDLIETMELENLLINAAITMHSAERRKVGMMFHSMQSSRRGSLCVVGQQESYTAVWLLSCTALRSEGQGGNECVRVGGGAAAQCASGPVHLGGM